MPRCGSFAPFVDPVLPALNAPVRWLPTAGVARLKASAVPAAAATDADLTLDQLGSVRHVVAEPDGAQSLLFHTTAMALILELRGASVTDVSVNVTFHIDRLANAKSAGALLIAFSELLATDPRRIAASVSRLLLRNALIAVDGRLCGASYRDIADVAFGGACAAKAWSSESRAMKDHIIRASKKGAEMLDGGYRQLLRQG
jgi:hypothetical protein